MRYAFECTPPKPVPSGATGAPPSRGWQPWEQKRQRRRHLQVCVCLWLRLRVSDMEKGSPQCLSVGFCWLSGIRSVIELTPVVCLSRAQKANATFCFAEVVTLGTLAVLAAFVLTFILVRTDRTTWSAKKQAFLFHFITFA